MIIPNLREWPVNIMHITMSRIKIYMELRAATHQYDEAGGLSRCRVIRVDGFHFCDWSVAKNPVPSLANKVTNILSVDIG